MQQSQHGESLKPRIILNIHIPEILSYMALYRALFYASSHTCITKLSGGWQLAGAISGFQLLNKQGISIQRPS
jgi:hypothetical protein